VPGAVRTAVREPSTSRAARRSETGSPAARATRWAVSATVDGVRYETVSSASRHPSRSSGVSMRSQLRAPAADDVWATSPTMVIDRVGTRRTRARQAMGDSSCASSTTTWP
jgi:hypothetical protein